MQKTIKEKQAIFWNEFAPTYNDTDSASLTFFYTLLNMLELPKSKHILEIACGTGKLIPQAVLLKPDQTTYLATDLSPAMVEMSKNNIQSYLQKMGVTTPLEAWMQQKNIRIEVADGEEKIDAPYKFDRILANLVVHIVPDPVKMMKNIWEIADEGCLLGVSIWGRPEDNNFFPLFDEAEKAKKQIEKDKQTDKKEEKEGEKQQSESWQPYALVNKLKELGQKSGWEAVLLWDQNSVFPFYEITDSLKKITNLEGIPNSFTSEYVLNKCSSIFKEKKALVFGCQLAIFRKK